MIHQAIANLVAYAIKHSLMSEQDSVYARNQLMDALQIDAYVDSPAQDMPLESILAQLLDYACAQGIIEDTTAQRDLFDARLMGILLAPPSHIIREFSARHANDPRSATDWYYTFSQSSDYIRTYRIKKDIRWTTETEYGTLDITINLSKPEKDPRDIAAAKKAKPSGYPKCLLCRENEGYAGNGSHPARQNHRLIPLRVGGESWFLQYSPYVYYNEHCIALNAEHRPMRIDRSTFVKLFDFLEYLPHYFIGSNADLPIVGGSILSHDHFQGGHYQFAMERAKIEQEYRFAGHPSISAGRLQWPMSVLRLRAADPQELIDIAEDILQKWREYSDESVEVHAYSGEEPHNTITPIARRKGADFELDLVLRNNRTTEEHPLGIFHPHADLHHIKKENIGLIEVMGLAVLPARLLDEMELLKRALLDGADLAADARIASHAPWGMELREKYGHFDADTIDAVIEAEIGLVFSKVLRDAGVFSRDAQGHAAFDRFIAICGGETR